MSHFYRNLRNLSLALCSVPLLAFAADGEKASDPAKGTAPTTAPAPATGKPAEIPPLFIELDKDKDGQVSKAEAKRSAEVSARFDELDSDRSGKISVAEWQAFIRK